ncbi:uncharacterized protein LY89DRAFT_685052 [Mollisia scopiformis]|uniref:Cardiolipin synthase N-terminal domain-containing protein n=1 Tax=Mollisia scopiformis TaxID=149040 RepID=A0A194XA98_MOLSC|nr:uncharacterized protein LY89DRAFT_685052 [Mollisia scopiformis]KUJ17098.1 hypothetical protein LY89DRAFT_685052 [Mollisia scopiformis]
MIQQILLNLFLVSLAMAEETVSTSQHGNAWKYGTGGGLLGFVILILDIMVFMEVLKSNRPPSHKLLWCVVVFLFPILGLVFYWLFSNREKHMGSGGYEAIP